MPTSTVAETVVSLDAMLSGSIELSLGLDDDLFSDLLKNVDLLL